MSKSVFYDQAMQMTQAHNDGPIIVWCEKRGCTHGFEWRGDPEDLKEELSRRGWGFHEHYTEDQAHPARRELYCPEHV